MGVPSSGIVAATCVVLLQLSRNEFGHFKHRDLTLAAEYSSELLVSIDHALVGAVLQFVLFDVIPNSLGNFSSRLSSGTDYRCEG